jgi:hypothetical protein
MNGTEIAAPMRVRCRLTPLLALHPPEDPN